MFEKVRLLFIYAVSPVHMGAGQATGVIDNPIQRERHTDHPMIAGSGLKGALRHHLEARSNNKTEVARLFGPESSASDFAGCVSFGDAQLVAFPVRSLKQGYVWAVSPVSLARLKRLALYAGVTADWTIPSDSERALVADKRVLNDNRLVLEAFDFDADESPELKAIASWLRDNALPGGEAHAHFRDKLACDLVLLPEEAYGHFVRHATVVEPHVRINDETGTADDGGLFYTENLPPESLLASPVLASLERKKDGQGERMTAEAVMQTLVSGSATLPGLDGALIQVGGDATTGRGLVMLRFAPEKKEG